MKRAFIGAGLWLFLMLPMLSVGFQAQAQTQDAEEVFRPVWSLGLTGQLETLQWPGVNNPETPLLFTGVQTVYRMSPTFASGGTLLFESNRSEVILQANTRWYWPLYVAEPYLGTQLEYFTRTDGGVSIALRPGVQIPLPFLNMDLDFYALGRYDVVGLVLRGRDPLAAAHFSLGASVMFRL